MSAENDNDATGDDVKKNKLKPGLKIGVLYLVFVIFYMCLYEIMDSYTTTFYPMVVSVVTDDLGVNLSEYYSALSIASLGLFGVFIVQFLADVIGRKLILIIVFFGMGLGSFLLSLSDSLSQYSAALFIMFIFFSSDVWVIYIAEEAPRDKRARYTYIVSIVGVIGSLAVPLIRSLLVDAEVSSTWRNMTYIGWLAMPLSLIGLFLKETTAYEIKKKQDIELKAWHKEELLYKIKTPFIKKNLTATIAFIIIGFLLGMNFSTFQTIEEFFTEGLSSLGTPNEVKDLVSIVITVGGAGSLIVYFITGPLADKYGRKIMLIAYAVLCIIGMIGLVITTEALLIAGVYIFAVFTQMGYWGAFSLVKIYCIECFETKIRGNVTGWRSFAYAAGLTIGNALASVLLNFISVGGLYILYAMLLTIVVPIVVLTMLPETKGIEMIE